MGRDLQGPKYSGYRLEKRDMISQRDSPLDVLDSLPLGKGRDYRRARWGLRWEAWRIGSKSGNGKDCAVFFNVRVRGRGDMFWGGGW